MEAGADVITTVTGIVTKIFGMFSDVFTVIAANPVLLLGVGMFMVGGVIGLVSRLFKSF